ncbi:RmlC-like cupin domain-containing protein [Chytriomyces sp. MP71]|nr:RmlC-like cupin domain-containing protein [Chytriomyces sp. MP71]
MSRFTIRTINVPTPMATQDPFLFAVYHKDQYPAGDDKMQAPRRGNGSDFDTSKLYRMYHGDRIPGFPQHPHRGFETITCTIEGTIDHTDSLGCGGRYGNGDLQWMTAGKGIVHGEMFPLVSKAPEGNLNRFFQLWINLPSKSKMVPPNQLMHWSERVTRFTTADTKTRATVWAGNLHGHKALDPIKDSWANNPVNDVNIWFLQLQAGAKFVLPKSAQGSNRTFYLVEGNGITLDETTKVPASSMVEFKNASEADVTVENTGGKDAEILVLQGKPIGEPVVQHGPFVMNTREEIMQAFTDYRTTQFGGWPWPEDAMVFPREKGRFLSLKGQPEELPPAKKGGDHGEL